MENTVQLQNTTVGPILGHITTTTARIFLRGGDQLKKDNSVRIAAVRYRDSRNTLWKVHTKTIQRENDNTVVIQLSGLSSNKNYTFQIGWCNASNEFLADPDATESFIWPQKKFKFRTQSDTSNLKRSYLIGSCRYLNITAGIPISAGQSSSIFRAMARQKIKTDALVMVGDQIYADDMNALGQDTSLNDFLLKYRAAFSEKNIRKLMAKTPTYMILDDHEIEDNWPANKSDEDTDLFNNAIRAYEIYQSSHGPAHSLLPDGSLSNRPTHYWYQFSHGSVEWFVLDTRTQRNLSSEDRRILDIEQEKALLDWLACSTAKVKFVVTSVMFYPDLKEDGEDSWKSFAEQRNRILESIRLNKVKNVFFIAGDVHASMTSKLTHSEDKDFVVHTIVCSPLNCIPLFGPPTADAFMLDQVLSTVNGATYAHTLTCAKVISTDNFSRVTVEGDIVSVSFHNKRGTLLETVNIALR
ncbi:alkaline phosphatase family protein [Pseudomonas sp. TH35]|jgi:Phosphodiesterase/alkaline phosphatase D|uniref:Phosphodiesterase n=1 Tax=Pseudomonas lini TaxID=163011 RepID=A0A423IJ54_9PSED|nr:MULTISPECIES: alkaline phosphatase D family protein [unclassified Erwinia]MBK5311610.1 alkaline phosphatase family protein [Pseudomonas sp. TH71]MBK5370814.1 alkaline phosphatase family protein [Pseudomonas sp. TH40]MBK5381983.1 alkaline phosphatase family protein [Pseudomonas sp. TH35]MBK5387442.1 alkaline phosphatase family protein [Pseudomonas sp. TH38]MBK5404737.1 alkaline phosphatase family protein [Pseudomonas sp. TH37]MBK5466835.1 alkaline phosphatase family protein [Pseudomonas sp.